MCIFAAVFQPQAAIFQPFMKGCNDRNQKFNNMIINRMFLLALSLLALCFPMNAIEVEVLPLSTTYEMTEMGYLESPQLTIAGLLLTDNRQQALYVVEDGALTMLLSAPGCGRYTELSADGTRLALKHINANGKQAPAVLDLKSGELTLLNGYVDQCGQPTVSPMGDVAYTVGRQLHLMMADGKKQIALDYYTNIVRFSPDGRFLAWSDADGRPVLFDLQTMQQKCLSEQMDLYNPKWSPDGSKLLYEQGNMTLYVIEIASGKMYCLGNGSNAQWMDDERIIYTRSEYRNGDIFFCEGISVVSMRYNGEQSTVLIQRSADCPMGVYVSGNRLFIAYARGDRRVVAVDLREPKKEEVLVRLAEDEALSFTPLPAMYTEGRALSGQNVGGPVMGDDIPYIHQRYDVAAYNGSYAYGPCACAPSTSCMVLGYYGLLQPHAVSSRGGFGYPSTNYAYYVGQVYTHHVTNYVFNQERYSSCGGSAAGGYGFMWTNGSPSSKMGDFYTHNNCPSNAYDNRGMVAIRQECSAGMPYSWCITSSKTSGHLILPYRADAEYVNVNGSWTYQALNGSVVVHDPYGNANMSSWGYTDGRSATYDYSGYNNGHLQMVNAWGVAVHLSRTPFNIEYELNGGLFTEDSIPMEYYTDLTLPIPVKDGCEFLGWYADESYSGNRWVKIYPGCGVSKVFALWSDMPLVKYVLNGGVLPEGVELPAVVKDTITLPTPIRKGFDFTGWLWETDMLGDPVTHLYPGDEGRLWATWTRATVLDNKEAKLRYVDNLILNPNGLFVAVYSASGTLVASGCHDISLRDLPAGIYVARAGDACLKIMR